jgi:hypothetical protein
MGFKFDVKLDGLDIIIIIFIVCCCIASIFGG